MGGAVAADEDADGASWGLASSCRSSCIMLKDCASCASSTNVSLFEC
jgi:hypothetical protein